MTSQSTNTGHIYTAIAVSTQCSLIGSSAYVHYNSYKTPPNIKKQKDGKTEQTIKEKNWKLHHPPKIMKTKEIQVN